MRASGSPVSAPRPAPNGGLFLDAETLTRPFDAELGRGQGLGFSAGLGAKTTLSAGFVAADGAGRLADRAGEGVAAGFAVTHAANDRLSLRAGLRWLGEEDAMLGSRGEGAFALNGGDTRAFETGLTYGFAPAWTLDATAGLGDGGAAGDGVVRRFEDVRTAGWSLGLTRTGVLDAADRLGVLVGQPLRAFAGTAELDVPVGRDLEGNVLRERSKVGLEPDGRELQLQFAYERTLDDATRLSAFALYPPRAGARRRRRGRSGGRGALLAAVLERVRLALARGLLFFLFASVDVGGWPWRRG